MGFISNVTEIVLILICFTGFLINRKRNTWLVNLLPYYLLCTLVIEQTGYLYSHFYKKSNHFIFNVDLVIEFIFWTIFFAFQYQSKKIKKMVLVTGAIFLLFAVFNLYKNNFWIYNSVNDSVSSVLITAYCFIFLAELFISDVFMNYFSIPTFWIATGLLFFNAGDIAYTSLFNYIISAKLDPAGKIYEWLIITLNLLMYGLFTTGSFAKKLWRSNS